MVQAVITLNERADRVLNIVKGKFGLKNKSEAVSLIITEYEEEMLEPALRPEYKKRLSGIIRRKHLSRKDFKKAVK